MLLKDLQTLATKLATGTLFHVEKAGKAYSVDYSALAKAIIEEYADSTVGGSKQSVQAAIGALNSSFTVAPPDGLTKVKPDLTFGSQNRVYKYGRIVFVTVVFTTTSDARQNDILFTTPHSIRFPVIVNIRNDEGNIYLIGTDIESSSDIKALYGSGLPAGAYRGTFTYLAAL